MSSSDRESSVGRMRSLVWEGEIQVSSRMGGVMGIRLVVRVRSMVGVGEM